MEIRCSGLSRPMNCAGFLFFKDLPPEEEIQAAKDGTAAGEYLRYLLEKKTPIPTHAANGVQFDSDMDFFTRPVAEEILAGAESEILCEQRIDWQTRSGIMIRGSYDISFVKDGNLHVEDLKYGWGLVEVKNNWQLLGYAIGEVIRRGQAFEKIILRVHQPRPHHEDGPTRTWELSYAELLSFKEIIEARMDKIVGGYKDLVTGPQCKYCPAAAYCPSFNKAFYRGIEHAQEFTQDNIDDKELSFQLDLIARVSEVLKIKSDSIKALAINRIKNGTIIPNYMTESSYGDRKWKKDISPKAVELLTGKKIVKEEMLSPAQAEKAGVPKDFISQLVDRHFLGQKLVRKDSTAIGNKIFGAPPNG